MSPAFIKLTSPVGAVNIGTEELYYGISLQLISISLYQRN
jgi:hypothetical protein